MEKNCYIVIAKCGHVGKNYYLPKTFAVKANNGRDAANAVRGMKRVKHHHKDAIISVTKCTQEEYMEAREANREDPYFSCKSIQDQRAFCGGLNAIRYETSEEEDFKKRNHIGGLRKRHRMEKRLKKEANLAIYHYKSTDSYELEGE